MPVKRYRFKKHKKAIQKEMLAVMEYHGETFASQIEKMIEKIIAQTFRFATSFGSTGASNLGSDQAGLSDATVFTRSEVKASKRGVEINIYATVVDPSGKAHLVWHILSQGRKPYVFPVGKTSPPIRRRKGHRTKRGNLKVSAFPGFMGDDTDTFVIVGGTLVAGIEPRKWYDAAAKEFANKFRLLPNVEMWQLRGSIIREVKV